MGFINTLDPIHRALLPLLAHVVDILHRNPIVEQLLGLVPEMSQTIPLR